MTNQAPSLSVQQRSILGKKVKRLRQEGLTPVHLYGRGIASMALQADSRTLLRTLVQVGRSRPVTLEVQDGGGRHLAFVRDIQFHPVNGQVLHVDLLQVDVSVTTRVEVPLELHGEAPAVRLKGGSLIQGLHTVLLEAKPLEVPELLSVDVSVLEDFDQVIRIADLPAAEGITVITDPEQVIAHVTPPVGEAAAEVEAAAAEPELVSPEHAEPETAEEPEEGE